MFVCVCVQCLLESASPELRVWSSSVPYLNISTLGMTVLVKASGQFHCGSQGTPTILFETVHCHSFQPFSREFRKTETLMGWVLTCFDAPNTTSNIVFSHLCFASLLYRSVIPYKGCLYPKSLIHLKKIETIFWFRIYPYICLSSKQQIANSLSQKPIRW